MFYDAIVNKDDVREVIYNAIPNQVQTRLLHMTEEERAKVLVLRGRSLTAHTVDEYLAP